MFHSVRLRLTDALVGLLCVAALAVAAVAIGLALTGPRAPARQALTQQQAEQLASQYLQSNYPGAITALTAQPLTLGQLNGPLGCSAFRQGFAQILEAAGLSDYSPCDANTPLWVITADGSFSYGNGRVGDRIEVVFTSAGEFIRAGGSVR
jgi:hypothetical protein